MWRPGSCYDWHESCLWLLAPLSVAPSKRRRERVSLGSNVVRDRPAYIECVDIKFAISVDCEIICEML